MAIKDNVVETLYYGLVCNLSGGTDTKHTQRGCLLGVHEVLSTYMESSVTALNLTPGWKYTFNFEMFCENIMLEIEKQWRELCIFKVLASKPS